MFLKLAYVGHFTTSLYGQGIPIKCALACGLCWAVDQHVFHYDNCQPSTMITTLLCVSLFLAIGINNVLSVAVMNVMWCHAKI